MQALLAGLGIGQVDSINAAAPTREGLLVPLFAGAISERMGLYLYYAQRTDMPVRGRRFADFAASSLVAVRNTIWGRRNRACSLTGGIHSFRL